MSAAVNASPEAVEMQPAQSTSPGQSLPATSLVATPQPPPGGGFWTPKWLAYAVLTLALGGTTFTGVNTFKPDDKPTLTEVRLLIQEHSHRPHDGVEALVKAAEDRAVSRALEACRQDRIRDLKPMRDQLKRIEASMGRLEEHLLNPDRRRR